MEIAFRHYQYVTENISLILKIEKEYDILKDKIIKHLNVRHSTNGMVQVITSHPLLSQSPPVP